MCQLLLLQRLLLRYLIILILYTPGWERGLFSWSTHSSKKPPKAQSQQNRRKWLKAQTKNFAVEEVSELLTTVFISELSTKPLWHRLSPSLISWIHLIKKTSQMIKKNIHHHLRWKNMVDADLTCWVLKEECFSYAAAKSNVYSSILACRRWKSRNFLWNNKTCYSKLFRRNWR